MSFAKELAKTLETMRAMAAPPPDRIVCHPDNADCLFRLLRVDEADRPADAATLAEVRLYGIQIAFDTIFPVRDKRKVFLPPADRFITYEATDFEWLKALGFGQTVEVDNGPLILLLRGDHWERFNR